MSNPPIREWLDLWHALLAEPAIPSFKAPRDMAGVLADLRRDPERLAKAFEPLPHGKALLSRVKRCVDAEQHHNGLYLVPDPVAATDDELRALVIDALERGSQCCGIDVPRYPINVVRRAMTAAQSVQAASLVEELDDRYSEIAHLQGLASEAMQFLGEALYTLAASVAVQGYCLTPLCPDEVRPIEPYASQIELWLRGAHGVVRWNKDADDLWVEIYVNS